MPRIEIWSRLPPSIRGHLVDRMRDRKIGLDDLNRLRLWIESKPEVPEDSGTRVSSPSKAAAKESIPRLFFWRGNRPRAKGSNAFAAESVLD